MQRRAFISIVCLLPLLMIDDDYQRRRFDELNDEVIRLKEEQRQLAEMIRDAKSFVLKVLAAAITLAGGSIVKDLLLLRRQSHNSKQ